MHANFLAPLFLGTFPLVMLGLFLAYRPAVAVMVSLLAAEMFLPPLYALPISPSWLTKWTLPPLVAGILVVIFGRSHLRRSHPLRGVEGIFLLSIVVAFMTFLTNRDPLHYGRVVLPGEDLKDLLGEVVQFFVIPWTAFFLGRILFKTSRDLKSLTRLLAISVLIYSALILIEIRTLPDLNQLVYGYQASRFDMTLRWGGYRPTVFFKDGLPLASFVLTCTLMILAMARVHMRLAHVSIKAASFYVLVVLVICKSTGVVLYALLIVPLICLAAPRRILMVASSFVLCFLIYPVLRFSDVIPVKSIADLFAGLSRARADSLLYRFNMEQLMMDLTKHRLWWGWGGWGRNLVYDSYSGRQISIPDGAVIITLSAHGMVGLFSYYFPFAYTVLRAPKFIRRIKSRSDRLLLSALTVNCAVILFDLIVNSAFPPIYMLIFGALCGLPAGILKEEATQAIAVTRGDAGLAVEYEPAPDEAAHRKPRVGVRVPTGG
ncbi:MAG TPA: hypothetical protein VH374_23010 [Polyangia bacterium]|jgi:hypothetical protein|nr:hypothetical protein [Polyangia bacterium]